MFFIANNRFLCYAKLISTLRNESSLVYGQGRFDNWCIYHINGKTAQAIKDVEIFSILQSYAHNIERFSLHNDFLHAFEKVTEVFNYDVVEWIKNNAKKYRDHKQIVYIFTFLYAGMVAEVNKQKAILKKYIKRLGVHQVLIEGRYPKSAANYPKGKKWQEFRQECEARGFYSHNNQTQLSA